MSGVKMYFVILIFEDVQFKSRPQPRGTGEYLLRMLRKQGFVAYLLLDDSIY